MAPYAHETDMEIRGDEKLFPKLKAPQADPNWKYQVSWLNVFLFSMWHAFGLYGGYLLLTGQAKLATVIYSFVLLEFSLLGITAGSHRLWSHKSYKAKLPLQIILMVFNTLAGQYSAHNWIRDHRLHHKYSDTDADPHNASRGFFFSHIGWLFVVKHPEVKKRGAAIDMSDITSNPVLAFQKKYAAPWFTVINYILPTVIPMYFWGEPLSVAWHMNIFRFITSLNIIMLVNSAAHMFGNKPFDKNIQPCNNKYMAYVAVGECYHNYHHTFPWDYKSPELGNEKFNITTKFIDFFAWIGWAYDLKTVDEDMISTRAARTGDGTLKQIKSNQSTSPMN